MHLPERRQAALLWRYAPHVSPSEVAAVVDGQASQQCPWKWNEDAEASKDEVAIRGDDGRYHLMRRGQLACMGWSQRKRRRDRSYRHEFRCWLHFLDGTYRLQVPTA
jgi:hypothetical protein